MFDPIHLFMHGTPYSDRFAAQCRGTLEQTELIEQLRVEKLDVMIAENFDMCGIGLSHIIQPKSLINGAASVPQAWMFEEFGLPKESSYNPSPLIDDLDIHSIWSRLTNLYADFMFYSFFRSSSTLIENLFKDKYGPEFPTVTVLIINIPEFKQKIQEISSRAAYTILNSKPLVDFATPTLTRIVHVGGLGAREPKRVEKEFDNILSLRNKTVLISFGSLVASSQLQKVVKQTIVETVAKFPEVTFIWKYEKPQDNFTMEALAKAPNLHSFKWIPQNLGNPVSLFPASAINQEIMERSGLGKVFDKRDFYKSGKFAAAIGELLENQSYYENARRIATMIAKKPFSAREQLIKTVEFAAEFGPSAALRPQSYDMNWIAYHNLDIIIFFALILVALFAVLVQSTIVLCQSYAMLKMKLD